MNTNVDHLPEHKQEQLQNVVEIIREETEVEMVILFGSYAAGTWVEEPGPEPRTFEYQSDFDIYVLVEDRKVAKKGNLWSRIEKRLRREVPTPVQLLVDPVAAFNSFIGEGRYFHTDIRKLGICLYDSGRFVLAEPRELSPELRLERAREEYHYWFNSATSFLLSTQTALERDDYPHSAFLLHQATERLYAAALLVFTNYKPKLHDIEKLGDLAAGQAPELLPVFPRGIAVEERRFDLLRRAYIDGRYEKGYSISREELEWLLKSLTEEVCSKRIQQYSLQTESAS